MNYIFIIYLRKPCLLQGLALSSIGEYKKAENAHLKSLQIDRNFLEAWAHLTQVSINLIVLIDCVGTFGY